MTCVTDCQTPPCPWPCEEGDETRASLPSGPPPQGIVPTIPLMDGADKVQGKGKKFHQYR